MEIVLRDGPGDYASASEPMETALARMEAAVFVDGLIPVGGSGVVAVSGGRDSMVLLHLLSRWRERGGWHLVVASLDHGLRGEAGAADVAFVEAACGALGVAFRGHREEVGAARRPGESVETAARRVRHGFLARVAREEGCGWIALGHHGGDQAELFLMRLLRGAGAGGLSGMSGSDPSPADRGIRLVRPMLGCPSSEVAALAAAWSVAFRADATNADEGILRNRVRRRLLPLLESEYQPGLEAVLMREQRLLGDQAAWMEAEADRWLRERGQVRAPAFECLPVAMQREVIRLQVGGAGGGFGFEDIERLRASAGRTITVAGGRVCLRDAEGTVRWLEGSTSLGFREEHLEVTLDADTGEVPFAGGRLRWSRLPGALRRDGGDGSGESDGERDLESFDAAKVGRRVRLRHWRPGDRFQPIGQGASPKLQDLFTNARVPAGERRSRVLAETESGTLFWVEGLRIGDVAKVTPGTEVTLQWAWERVAA